MARQLKQSIEVQYDWHNYDREAHAAARREAIATAHNQANVKNTGKLVGEVVRWQVADGYAEYMVISEKPLVLQHINDGDGYRVDPALIRGLRLQDVRAMADFDRLFK